MITMTLYGEPIGDREYLPRSRCTCALDGCCLEHSYAIDDPGDAVVYGDWASGGSVDSVTVLLSHRGQL